MGMMTLRRQSMVRKSSRRTPDSNSLRCVCGVAVWIPTGCAVWSLFVTEGELKFNSFYFLFKLPLLSPFLFSFSSLSLNKTVASCHTATTRTGARQAAQRAGQLHDDMVR
jgi:hypothetical protein